jgi:hypothetical protein
MGEGEQGGGPTSPFTDAGQGRGGPTPLSSAGLLWPVFEFRPAPGILRAGYPVFRFADGQWLPDDGEYDLAFCAWLICLYVEPPYQRNIVWQGLTTPWRGHQPKHPRGGNPWHYMLREGTDDFGGAWARDVHPNAKAGRSGMDWTCAQYRSASGQHVEWNEADPHIAAGLVRDRETKEILRPPERLHCCFCGPDWHAAARPEPVEERRGLGGPVVPSDGECNDPG